MRKILKTLSLLLAGLFLAGNAFALSITLSDGSITNTYSDGGPDDINPVAGIISVNESIGVWALNASTGISDPFVGSNDAPYMDLVSINASTTTTGTHQLYVTLYDTYANLADLHDDLKGFSFNVGGTTGGEVQYAININGDVYSISDDAGFGPFSDGSFSGSYDVIGISGSDPFEASITAIITHTNSIGAPAVITSFDAELKPVLVPSDDVPVPATLSLLSIGLLAFVGISRRKAS